MEQLNQIITQKLKLINRYKDIPLDTLLLDRELYVDELLKEKRKQNSRQVLQSRLLQSLASRKIQAPYRLEQFFRQSFKMMQMYDPQFQFQSSENGDIITKIVYLFIAYFEKQDCGRKADQLKHIFQKSLCEKGMLIFTIMNWYIDWLRKIFKLFIKTTLVQISRKPLEKSKKSLPHKIYDELKEHQESILKIEEQLRENKSNASLRKKQSKSKLLQPQFQSKQQKKENILKRKKSSILKMNPSRNFKNSVQPNILQKNQSIPRSPSISELRSKEAKQGGSVYNKQMFYSAYFEEFTEYYKLFSIIPDLDLSYLRSFKKIYRREEFKNKKQEITKSIIRAQPLIRQSQWTYLQEYEKYGKKKQMLLLLKKEKKEALNLMRRRQLIKQKNMEKEVEQKKKRRSLIREKSVEKSLNKIKNLNQFSQRTKPQIHSKTMEIQLPNIPKTNVGYQKSSILHLKRQRYQQDGKFLHKKSRASEDLHHQIRDINSFFQRNTPSRKRIQYSARKIGQNVSLNRYMEFNEEIQEGDENGVFRLPKIGK